MIPNPLSAFNKLIKQPLIVALVAAILAGLILGAASPAFLGFGFSTTSQDITVENRFWEVTGHTEFIDESDHTYATGWKPDSGDVKSERITIQGNMVVTASGAAVLGSLVEDISYSYVVNLDNTFLSESPTYEIPIIGNRLSHVDPGSIVVVRDDPYTHRLENYELPLFGAHPGDRIEVTLKMTFTLAHYGAWPGDHITDDEIVDKTMSVDGAYLQSGKGAVTIGGALPDVIEEGSDATFVLQTGFTHNRGWTCYIFPPPSSGLNKIEFREDGFTGQDNFGPKQVSFTVPVGWFTLGSDNEVKIELRNGLWSDSVSTFFVVDSIDKIPGETTIDYTTDYKTGAPVLVNLQGTPSEVTLSPIDYFRVYVYYGAPGSMPGFDFPEEYIINGQDFQASNNQASFSFTITENKPGQISIKASAIDEDGRASLGAFTSMNVVNPPDPNPNPNPNPDPEYPFMWHSSDMLLLAVLVMFLAAIGFLLYSGTLHLGPRTLLIISVVASVLVVLIYLSGILAI